MGEAEGTVFNDEDGDGARDAAESGLTGWTVFADLNDNSLPDIGEPSAVTREDDPSTPLVDEAGRYLLNRLRPGEYLIRISHPASRDFEQTSPAEPQPAGAIKWQKCVDTSDVIPNDEGQTFTGFPSPPAIVGRQVVFQDGGSALFAATSDTVVTLVDSQTAFPGGAGKFASFGPSFAFDGRRLVFSGRSDSGAAGIYLRDESDGIWIIADGMTPVPTPEGSGAGQLFRSDSLVPQAIAEGLVAFSSRDGSNRPGLYVGSRSGHVAVLVDSSIGIPGTKNKTFTSFGSVDLAADWYVFYGIGPDGEFGIYEGDSPWRLSAVADGRTRIPAGQGRFTRLESFALSQRTVAFRGIGTTRQTDEIPQDGIYWETNDSPFRRLEVVADIETPIPSGAGNFRRFGDLSLDRGIIAFMGYGDDGQQGIYANLTDEDELSRIVDLNPEDQPEAFGDRTPREFKLGRQSLSGNQIVFHVTFTDDTEGIYVATLPTASEHIITLGPGGDVVDELDFGRRARPGQIAGQTFHDANANGTKDEGELGLAGWTVYLDENANGSLRCR